MSPSKPSILIAGAGPVGLTAALELERRGFSPRIIDCAEGPAGESRALGIHARTLKILEPSGMTERLLAVGNKVTRFRFMEQAETLGTLDLSKLDDRFAYVLVVPQAETERLLIDALAERGVAVEWNTSFVSSKLDGTKIHAQIASSGEQEESFSADVLIGADGSHSAVRKAAGIAFDGEGFPAEFGLADVRHRDPIPLDEACARFLEDVTLARFPMGPHVCRYVGTREDILKLLPGENPIEEVLWESNFHISFRHVARYQEGQVFLAGDAAHVHSPVGGRGMNLGIEDAAWLAWLIETGQTERYTSDRLPVAHEVIRFTKMQTKQLLARGPAANFVRRHVAPMMLKVPAIQRAAVRRLTGRDTPYPPWLTNN